MSVVNTNPNPKSLELACTLTNMLFHSDETNPKFEVAPTLRSDLEEVSGLQMDWMKIFKEQRLKTSQFMCTVRDCTTSEIVGFAAGKYRPRDCDGSRMSIDFLERKSDSLKGYMIKLALLMAYTLAYAHGCKCIKVGNPVPSCIELYKAGMPDSELHKRGNHSFIIASVDASMVKKQLEGFLPLGS